MYNWQLSNFIAIKMITKGPLIAYVPKKKTWNVFLNADMDFDDPHVFWCNTISIINHNMFNKPVSFKEAYDYVMQHKTYPIMIGVNELRTEDKLFVIENDTDAIQAILSYNYD